MRRGHRREPRSAFLRARIPTVAAFLVLAGSAVIGPGVPAGAATPGGSEFHAVSCTTATFCMAVGETLVTSSGPGTTLAERWNGTKWTVVASPDP